MTKIRTHYDNLKVARNAPIEVIRAAYKTLSQKYHPDKHPGNIDAVCVMSIINTSYDVLSDPIKREEHNQWIKKMEAESEPKTQSHKAVFSSSINPSSPSVFQRLSSGIFKTVKEIFIWCWYLTAVGIGGAILVSFLLIFFEEKKSPPPDPDPDPKPYQANPASVLPKYVRPVAAPNGEAWPKYAGYIKGYEIFHAYGLSNVTLDNSQNDSDVFVKLVSIGGEKVYPVRQFYIPAFDKFTLKNITEGRYDIRYRDLNSGRLSRSEEFALEEVPSYDGIEYSNFTMTLYKTPDGKMQTYDLSEAEF